MHPLFFGYLAQFSFGQLGKCSFTFGTITSIGVVGDVLHPLPNNFL